jgi:outer membrane protein insertion porin family
MKFYSTLILLVVFTGLSCIAPKAHAQIKLGESEDFSFSAPRKYVIASMRVEGTNNLDAGAIKLLSGLAIGDEIEIPGEKTAEAIKKLWKQDLFSDVQLVSEKVEGNKVFLVIRIKERSRLSTFKFSGVSKSEADDLREQINLYKEKIVTENLLIATKQKVYKYFKEKGFHNTEVNITQEDDPVFKNRIRLNIDISKNKKVRINEINIAGADFFSEYKVKRSLKETKAKTFFKPFVHLDTLFGNIIPKLFNKRKAIPEAVTVYGFEHFRLRLFKTSKFLESNYKEDKAGVIARYNQKGFRDARIIRDSVYKSGPALLDIDLEIEEGHRYYFNNIKWIGNTKYSGEKLSKILSINKGDVYDPVKLEQKLYMDPNSTDVTSLYMDNGYLFFQLEPVEILVGKDSIDLEIRMYEGEQARINRILISGNTKTNDHVIRRELQTKPGQLFSRSDIIRSQRQLNVLGFFDPEGMNVIPTPDPASGTVDIEYQVVEKSNDQLTLQGGYGGGILIATVGVQFNNFSTRNLFNMRKTRGLPAGDGQTLNLQVNTNGRQYQAFNASFTEPWLGGKKPTSLTVSTFYSFFSNGQRKYTETVDFGDVFNTSRQFFERVGASVQLGKRLKWPDNYFTGIVEASFQKYTLQNYGNTFFIPTGQANNLFLKFRVNRNSIDQQLFPTSGSDITLSIQVTPPYSFFNEIDYTNATLNQKFNWLEYNKWKFTAAFYNKIFDKFILYTKAGFGAVGLYNRKVGLVPFERFYLGGDPFGGAGGINGQLDSREIISLRGYGFQALSPATGATLINKYTAELRYPFSLNPSATIYGLAFAEAGNSWDSFTKYNPLQVYKSAGVGIRLFLPMFGLLGVDYAYQLDEWQPSSDSPSSIDLKRSWFHFTLGYQFGQL